VATTESQRLVQLARQNKAIIRGVSVIAGNSHLQRRPLSRQVKENQCAGLKPGTTKTGYHTDSGSDPRSLEIHLPGSMKAKLKGLILGLTRWVSTSPKAVLMLKPA